MGQRDVVSVVVPTRRRPQMLKQALESVFSSVSDDFDLDVIVVDDAPSMETQAIASLYPVTYVPCGGLGAAGARNAGMARMRGTLLAFLDDDDVFTAGSLTSRVRMLRDHPEYAAVIGRFVWVDSDLRSLGGEPIPRQHLPSGHIFQQLFRCLPQVGTLLIRVDAARTTGSFDTSLHGAEDWDWILRLSWRYPIGRLDTVVAEVRIHPELRDYSGSTREAIQARRLHDALSVLQKHAQPLPFLDRLRLLPARLTLRGHFAGDFAKMAIAYARSGRRQAAGHCFLLAIGTSPVHTALYGVRRLNARLR